MTSMMYRRSFMFLVDTESYNDNCCKSQQKTYDDKGNEGCDQSPDGAEVAIARQLLDGNNGQQQASEHQQRTVLFNPITDFT